MDKPTYSIVIPVYNEEDTLLELHKRISCIMETLDGVTEVILVDDGSNDGSYSIMLEINQQDPRFKLVHLSRNFGHQNAITAGMDFSSGQAIIIMDADLQDPPEVILKMVEQWHNGYEVIYAIREERDGESSFKKVTATLFYRFLKKMTDLDIPVDAGDFRLVDRKAMEAFKTLRENNRYVRGLFSWVGFKQTGVLYKRSKRFAGATKYPFRNMLKLATNAVIGFSDVPLRISLNLGFIVSFFSFTAGLLAVVLKISGLYMVSGWTSLIVAISFLGGVQMMLIGMIGQYIGRIYEEVKQRPLYIVRKEHGF